MEKSANELLVKDKKVNIQDESFPLISFIMPVYNDGETVEGAIDSIFDQDWPNIEVIAVNDGSTDNTKQVLNKLKKKHKNLTVVHFKKNKGACVARNEGAKLAKGKYYAWLPADARIYPGMVRVWVETLERFPEYDFLYGGYRFVDKEGNMVQNYLSDVFEPYLLEIQNYIDGSFPIRAETYWKVAKKIGNSDGVWDPSVKSLQDWDFWLSVVKDYGGKGLYYRDIFFETTLPHPGGLSYDSHQNWLARTRFIKQKHGIPERKICVTAPGAPFFGKYIAYILDADYKDMPPVKDHDYDMIYELGFYPSIAETCGQVFVDPKVFSQYEDLIRKKDGVPYAKAIKVVHLIGTDLLQMQNLSKIEMRLFRHVLNGSIDYLFTEYKETQKEAKELGLITSVLPLPPRKYFEPNPFPKDFTVAVYAPAVNQALYNIDLIKKVAKRLPKVKFKFFGNSQKAGKEGNIEYVGYVFDMQKFIDDCSCLLRITVHDGLPQSVLEFLSAGRRVIFNHDFPFVNQADKKLTIDAIVKAIKEEMNKGLNEEAAKYIRRNFTKEKFKKKIYGLLKYEPKEFWNRKAKKWADYVCKFYGTKDWEFIQPYVLDVNPKTIIDVGCGEGQWADVLPGEYLGIDIAENMIKIAKQRYPNKKFKVVSLEDAPRVINKKFDLAFCYTVFEHIPEENMEKAIKSLKKIAKKAIIVEPIDIETKEYCYNHNYHKWFKIIKEKKLGKRNLMVVEL